MLSLPPDRWRQLQLFCKPAASDSTHRINVLQVKKEMVIVKQHDALCKMRQTLLPWPNSWKCESGRRLPKRWKRHNSKRTLAEVVIFV